LCDAVTSGGLLLSVPQTQAETLIGRLHEAGVHEASIIGSVVEEHTGRITVK
jgi:selenide,water dikinase